MGVLFEEDFSIRRAAAIPVATVRQRARDVRYVNGATFYLTDDVWQQEGVVDLTAELRQAAAEWPASARTKGSDPRSRRERRPGKENGVRKYAPLLDHLRSLPSPADVTLAEIDRLVGGLPRSAYTYREWWANHIRNPQARAWLEAGRRVEEADLGTQRIRFS